MTMPFPLGRSGSGGLAGIQVLSGRLVPCGKNVDQVVAIEGEDVVGPGIQFEPRYALHDGPIEIGRNLPQGAHVLTGSEPLNGRPMRTALRSAMDNGIVWQEQAHVRDDPQLRSADDE